MSINYLVAGNTLCSKTVGVNRKKIKHIKIIPSKLELSLLEWPDYSNKKNFTIDICLKDFSDRIFTILRYDNKNDAMKEYGKLLNKIKKGNYELHIYSNGNIKLKY